MSPAKWNVKVSDERILSLVRDSDGMATAPGIAEQLDMTRQGVHKRLRQLEDDGLVEQRKLNATTAVWIATSS
jgi:predicted transcriptional regulator